MCTSIFYRTNNSYFGRNLDLEYSYNEEIVITPRDFKFNFKSKSYAIIGMAYVQNGFPLYYDGINEHGLGVAGLNFPDNACYFSKSLEKNNIASFEFIPYILSNCKNISEAIELINNTNITNESFSDKLKTTPLHWMIADKTKSITVECVKEGIKIYENIAGVLTNNPDFNIQMFNLNNYMNLSPEEPKNNLLNGLNHYSRGMGAIGLPGDLSSQSRFVRAIFTKVNSISKEDENESISQFFHILSSVEQQRGCVKIGEKYVITLYSSCCNLNKGIYYYKTYDNSQINAVCMHKENLETDKLITHPLLTQQSVYFQN